MAPNMGTRHAVGAVARLGFHGGTTDEQATTTAGHLAFLTLSIYRLG